MAKYHIVVPVKDVHGFQHFAVEADSEQAALAEWRKNGGDFVEEDLEVTDLDEANAEAELQDSPTQQHCDQR